MGVKERARAKKRKAAVSAKKLTQRARLEHKAQRDGRGGAGAAKKQTLPFDAQHRVLLVGEGDFSFSCAMAQLLPGAALRNMVTTTLDSEQQTRKKYPRSKKFTDQLKRRGVTVKFGVDATAARDLEACTSGLAEPGSVFDRIVFQFPHSGQQRVHVNRALLRDFFEAACTVLAQAGQAVVTLKDRRPYSGWLLEEQAAQANLRLVRSVPFDPKKFPGYRHVTTEAEAAVDGTHGFEVIFAKMSFFGRTAAGNLTAGNVAATGRTTARSEQLAANEVTDAEEDTEEATLRRKIMEMGGEDPRKQLKQQDGSNEEQGQARAPSQHGQSGDTGKIVFSDTEGSDLDEEDSSGDEKFIAQMIEGQLQNQVQQDARIQDAEKIVFSDTDGSDLDAGDSDEEGALSSGDESFIAKMQRIYHPQTEIQKPQRQNQQPQTREHADMTEEERHDAMLEAARRAARERREAAKAPPGGAQAPQAQPEVQAAVPGAAVASSPAKNADSTSSAAGSAGERGTLVATTGSSATESQVHVGSRVRCLYPSDGGRYPATVVSISTHPQPTQQAERMNCSGNDDGVTVIVKWDDGDTQHTERPLSEVWPLTESDSDSDPEAANHFRQVTDTDAADAVNLKPGRTGSFETGDKEGAVDVRAYTLRNRPVSAKEKAALLKKLQNAGRAAMLGNRKRTAAAVSHAPTWPVPGQSIRLTSSRGTHHRGTEKNSGGRSAKRSRKASSSRRSIVVQET